MVTMKEKGKHAKNYYMSESTSIPASIKCRSEFGLDLYMS